MSRFTQAEIARILRAAIKTGARTVIEVREDGSIRIIANEPPATPPLEKPAEIVL